MWPHAATARQLPPRGKVDDPVHDPALAESYVFVNKPHAEHVAGLHHPHRPAYRDHGAADFRVNPELKHVPEKVLASIEERKNVDVDEEAAAAHVMGEGPEDDPYHVAPDKKTHPKHHIIF